MKNSKTRINYKKLVLSHNSTPVAGFTILELMIAAMVFAVILLIVATGTISFTNSYYSGITRSNVQSVARSIMSEVSQSIEFSTTGSLYTLSPVNVGTGVVDGYCIANTMYSYELGIEVVSPPSSSSTDDQGYHGLEVDSNAKCSSGASPNLSQNQGLPQHVQELLNQHMRLGTFDITQQSGNLYIIHIRVIYGDNVVLNNIPASLGDPLWSSVGCVSNAGSFCAVSDLTTSVEQRII